MRSLSMLLLFGLAAGLLAAPAAATQAGDDDTKPVLKKNDKLTADDPKDTVRKQSHAKVYPVKLRGGQTYRIDMVTKETPQHLDPFLRLEDAEGKQLAEDDDGGGDHNAKIIYRVGQDGTYKVVATSFASGQTGSYTLTVRQATQKDEDEEKAKDKLLKAQREGRKKLVEIQQKVNAFRNKSVDEQKDALQEMVKDFTSRKDALTRLDEHLALELTRAVDPAKDAKWAATVYAELGKALAQADNAQVAHTGKMLEAAIRRLPGNTIAVKGKTLEGKEIDLKDYRGKVVLVDFWATWCGPCLGELPNVKKLYEAYHDKGFEVLAVSIDAKKADLEKFLGKEKLPWVCIHDVQGAGSLSDQFGVMFIPLPLLVDGEGRVVSMNARGQDLERLLEKHLGDKEKTK